MITKSISTYDKNLDNENSQQGELVVYLVLCLRPNDIFHKDWNNTHIQLPVHNSGSQIVVCVPQVISSRLHIVILSSSLVMHYSGDLCFIPWFKLQSFLILANFVRLLGERLLDLFATQQCTPYVILTSTDRFNAMWMWCHNFTWWAAVCLTLWQCFCNVEPIYYLMGLD